MSSKYRFSLLTGALAAGLALGPIADRVSAEPGHDVLTSMVTPHTGSEFAASDLGQPVLEQIEAAQPENQPQSAIGSLGEVSEAELQCLAKVIDHEAGNQPREGKLAVAHVMLNRVKSSRFPSTFCGVAYQPRQFSYITRYQVREGSVRWQQALEVAREALSGASDDHSNGALFFHARFIKPNSFFQTRTRVAALEDHIFYR